MAPFLNASFPMDMFQGDGTAPQFMEKVLERYGWYLVKVRKLKGVRKDVVYHSTQPGWKVL